MIRPSFLPLGGLVLVALVLVVIGASVLLNGFSITVTPPCGTLDLNCRAHDAVYAQALSLIATWMGWGLITSGLVVGSLVLWAIAATLTEIRPTEAEHGEYDVADRVLRL